MKENGFTLVELLVTIVIISVIAMMGSIGINAAKKGIYQSIWNTNVELIEAAGEKFGSDKKNYISGSCTVDGVNKSPCSKVTVQKLIDQGYLNTKDTISYNGDNKYKVIVNKNVDKKDYEDDNFENGYYVNNYKVAIYIENDIVYAKYLNEK